MSRQLATVYEVRRNRHYVDKTAFIERLLAKGLGPTSCRGRGGLAKLGPDTLKELFAGRRPGRVLRRRSFAAHRPRRPGCRCADLEAGAPGRDARPAPAPRIPRSASKRRHATVAPLSRSKPRRQSSITLMS